MSQLNDDKQTEIKTYAFDQLCKLRSSKGSKYSGSSSRISNDSDHSELIDVINELLNIDTKPKVRHSSSFFVLRNIPISNIDPRQHLKQSPQTLQNVRSFNFYMPRPPLTPPPTPSILKAAKLCNRDTSRSIASFIDTLIEGSETFINTTIDQSSSTMALLERDLESSNLPPMELLRFNGNPNHWPEFIQFKFKERVHMKRIFSDSLRMERLLSVLDGDAKWVLSTIRMFW